MPASPMNAEVENESSAGTSHSSESAAGNWLNKGLGFLHLMLFLGMSLWLTLTLEDWLFSSASLYPYLAAAGISSAVATGFAVLLIVKRCSWWMVTVLAVGMLWQTMCVVGYQFVGTVLGVAGLAFGLGWPSAKSETSSAAQWISAKYCGLAVLFAIGAFLVWRGLSLQVILLATRSSDMFSLGQGIGATNERDTIPFSLQLMQEQGLPLVVVLIVTTVCALFCGIFVLARVQGSPDRLLKIVICSIALGTLYGLLAIAPIHAPFETTSSVPGTWVFALSVASLGIAAAPKHQPKQRTFNVQSDNSSRKRMTSQFRMGLFVALIITIIGVEYSFHRRVVRQSQERVTVSLFSVSKAMQDATIAMEDGHFYSHHGFDWIAMHRALRVDMREGRVEQGGSTLTQQLAKNLFLSNDRTLWRKVQEAAYTAELEHDLSKQRILELYLNTIDYGMGQHGIKQAAAYYFHKAPAQLTLPESALLVGLVPHPPQTPAEFNDGRLSQGEQTALGRIAFFFPKQYSQAETEAAGQVPLDHLIYPDKDASDRGAMDIIPATWHGVGFYFFASPDEAGEIDHVSASLKPALAAFLDEAHSKYGLKGLDHLGVYNDRPMRQSQTTISAHAFGQAIDISGFRFKDGSHVLVSDHADPKVTVRLAPLEALLKKHFPVVVDWRDDPLRHQTHFHCEVRGPRNKAPAFQATNLLAAALSTSASRPNAPTAGLQPVHRLHEWRQGELVRQTTPTSCGPASLATVLTYYLGRPTSDDEMINDSKTRGQNTSSGDLEQACNAIGYQATSLPTLTLPQLLHQVDSSNVPAVVLWTHPDGHWVVLVGHQGNSLLVSNPNQGNVRITAADFARNWGGGPVLKIQSPD